jgi:ADP-heptose:LPS heptosyltransferase
MDQIADPMRPSVIVERWTEVSSYRAVVENTIIQKILVIKADHIGDFVLSFDAIVALREAFPRARIDLLCAPWNEELARSLDVFDQIHTVAFFAKRADGEHPTFNPEMIASLRSEHYDLAIDLRVDPDTRVILRYVLATYKVGFDSPEHRGFMTMFLPHFLPGNSDSNVAMHQTLLMLRLARSAVDLFKRSDEVSALLLGRIAVPAEIDLSIARDRMLVVCNTSSGRAVKNWPAERFRSLIRWLTNDLDAVVLLLGGADQLEETAGIIQFCGSGNIISAVGKTSIREAIGLIPHASLFIGNDSALTHVAARLGVQTVALFSGIDPTVMWAPLGEHVTVLRAPVPCSPCHILRFQDCRGEHACILNITEASVRAAVRKILLNAPRYAQPSSPYTPALQDIRRHPMFRGWASSRQTQTPQRYGDNYSRYIAKGGQLRIEQLLPGFTHGNINNRGDLNRFYMFTLVFDQLIKEQIYGDIAELGVYKENTAMMLATFARQIGATAYLLDTFEGFDRAGLEGVDANKVMEFADTSPSQVQTLVGAANTRYVQGYFPDTAKEIDDDAQFCLVHIDCDLYAPFKHALSFFYDRLTPGGFMIMHDYSSLHWDGAERAVDEFFADKPESVVPVPDGSGTVIVRKARSSSQNDNWFIHRKSSGFANAWIAANAPGIEDFLSNGWSAPEPWGVWGLGPEHELTLTLTHCPTSDLELAVESTAALVAGRTSQTIAVEVGGHTLATWSYSLEHNTGIRVVLIPHDEIHLVDGFPEFRVTFRPQSVSSPREVDPTNPDDRPLGLGLVRFRQRALYR